MKDQKRRNRTRGLFLLATSSLILSACGKSTNSVSSSPKGDSLSSGSSSSSVVTGQAKIWSAYNTENLMKDNSYDLARTATLSFDAAKGEGESAQLMVSANEKISSFSFLMGKVSDGDGHSIAAKAFDVYAEWYVSNEVSNEADAYLGYYPDALIPMSAYIAKKQNSIGKGQNQGIWVVANIPSDATAGNYTGTGELTLDDHTYEIPLTLKVREASMPGEVHAQNAFLLWYNQIALGEGDGNATDSMKRAYYNTLVSHRVMPDRLPDDDGSETWLEDYVDNVAGNPAVNSYRLNVPNNQTNATAVTSLLTQLINRNIYLREHGNSTIDLFKKAYFYVNDEPTGSTYADVRNNDLIFTNAKKALAPKLSAYPELQKSLLSIKNIVTTPFNESLVGSDTVGGVQTWCPQFTEFNSSVLREKYASRQVVSNTQRAYGENVWWYGCITPASPFPSYHTDANLITSRLLSWMQFNYGIEGNLYWDVCYYQKYLSSGKTTTRDIWNDPNTYADCNGDGQLLYPGSTYGLKAPISTLRLESIREGNEDYEYFWLIDQKVKAYNLAHSKNLSTPTLLKSYFDGLFTDMKPINAPELFASKRSALLDLLEAVEKDSDSAIAELQK